MRSRDWVSLEIDIDIEIETGKPLKQRAPVEHIVE